MGPSIQEANRMKGILLGFAGGSGSGKSKITGMLLKSLGMDSAVIIQQDSYYHDLSHLPVTERIRRNFDHPDAIDSQLLKQQVKDLIAGNIIGMPLYDFKNHIRLKDVRRVGPVRVILLEGIFIFTFPELRELMDLKIFVDTAPDIRFIRRLQRDMQERGRTMASVIRQYETTTRPMHIEFVESSKKYADIIISGEAVQDAAIDLLRTRVESLLMERGLS